MKNKSFKDSKVFKVINSPISIIVALILLVVGLLIYTRFLISSVTLYTFDAYTDDITIIKGTIFTNHNINYFGDSKIIYNNDDLDIYDFKIGYYIKSGKDYIVISEYKTLESASEEGAGVSLKELLLNMDLSFTETSRDAQFISKENLNNIDSLVFLIQGFDKDGNEINIEVPIEVEKLTK